MIWFGAGSWLGLYRFSFLRILTENIFRLFRTTSVTLTAIGEERQPPHRARVEHNENVHDTRELLGAGTFRMVSILVSCWGTLTCVSVPTATGAENSAVR